MKFTLIAAALAASLVSAQQTCYSGVNIFQARGTGEAKDGSLQDVAANATIAAIPNSHLTKVLYPANFSFPISPNIGAQMMQQMILDYSKACPTSKIVIQGYSQGGEVAGNTITGGVAGLQPLSDSVKKQITAVVLYGDIGHQGGQPGNRGSCTTDSGSPRTGDAAQIFDSYAARTISFCDQHDPVCCAKGDQVTAHVSYFTQENASEVANFVKNLFNGKAGASASASAPAASGTAVRPTTAAVPTTATGSTQPKATNASTTAAPTGGSGAGAAGPSSVGSARPSQFTAAAAPVQRGSGSLIAGLGLLAVML